MTSPLRAFEIEKTREVLRQNDTENIIILILSTLTLSGWRTRSRENHSHSLFFILSYLNLDTLSHHSIFYLTLTFTHSLATPSSRIQHGRDSHSSLSNPTCGVFSLRFPQNPKPKHRNLYNPPNAVFPNQ